MMRITILLSFILLLGFGSIAQVKRSYNQQSANLLNQQYSSNHVLEVDFNLYDLSLSQINENGSNYISVLSEGMDLTLSEGNPALPQLTKLYYVPHESSLRLNSISFNEEIVKLKKENLNGIVMPSIGSVAKSDEPKKLSEVILSEAYAQNNYVYNDAVQLRKIGVMRNVAVYELTVNPVAYNPVQGEILVRKNISFNLETTGGKYLPGTAKGVSDNYMTVAGNTNKSISNGETVLIVSPLKYESTLQDYVYWKKQLGYNVFEAYLGEDIASADKETIKSYVESFYSNPDNGVDPLSYLVLVGDVSDIPAWSGTIDNHVTDLYYAEFTDDYLPDIYYGRLSVTDTTQLKNVIDKVVYTEKNEFEDNNYQNNHLLVSGVDSDYAPNYGNGAINYFMNYYSNTDNGITPKYYLYGSGSPIVSNSNAAKQSIIDDFNAGVGVAYYTAHCSSTGWSDPAFKTEDLSKVNNSGMYPLMIGNCCESAKFNTNSFAEDIIRLKNKGAVTYVGASDFSYWDEDYFWGIGTTNVISNNPDYDDTDLGVWDAWFHMNNEAQTDRAQTVGQMLTIGNLAVQSSNSTLKKYYWEIYHIIGDPTFKPAIKKYEPVTATFTEIIVAGQTELVIQAPAGSYACFTEHGQIIAGGFANEEGSVTLEFESLQNVGNKQVELVVTHADYKPFIDSLNVIAPNGPYVVFESFEIDDSQGNNDGSFDYNEAPFLDLNFSNYGVDDAEIVTVTLSSESEFVKDLSENENILLGTIEKNGTFESKDLFKISLVDNVPNGTEITLDGLISYNDTIERNFSMIVKIVSPNVHLLSYMADTSGIGNLNGILEAGEKATLDLYFVNDGLSQVSNTTVVFTSSTTDLLTTSEELIEIGGFEIGEEKNISIDIQVMENILNGAIANITYSIIGGFESEYLNENNFEITVGKQPEILMNKDTTLEIITARFYDSGGPEENYSSKENYTVTFKPYYKDQALKVDFNQLLIESNSSNCWDYLEIYDGTRINDSLIGSFCSNNFDSVVYSQNANGALTFRFISDVDINKAGWDAYISSVEKSNVNIEVTNGIQNISGVKVTFGRYSDTTGTNGVANFKDIVQGGMIEFTVEQDGYYLYTGEMLAESADTTIKILLTKLPEVCFSISSGTKPISGARILFNGFEQYSDEHGQATFVDQVEGTYAFYIHAEGYKDTAGYKTVPDYDICYNMSLEKLLKYSLELVVYEDSGAVDMASVSLFDELSNTNDKGVVVYDSLYAGNYELTIEKEGYLTYNSMFEMPERNFVDSIQILPETFAVIFNVMRKGERIEGATILMKNEYAYTTLGGQASFSGLRAEENIPFTVKHSAYNEYDGTFSIKDESIELDINLTLVSVYESENGFIQIYPNPVGVERELEINSNYAITNIELYSSNGVKVLSSTVSSMNQRIDLSGIDKGVYLLKVNSSKSVLVSKIILQ